MDEATPVLLGTILVVDDNSENLALARDILSAEGYRVLAALDGQAALRSLEAERPDLILLDVHMPRMDGYEVCGRIRGNPKLTDLPVLFLSGMDEAFNKVKAFETGASDYIVKPFQAAELLARVKMHMELSYNRVRIRSYAAHLEETLEELRQAERRMVESEKTAAIASMGSGLAHELNNPVNYIAAGIEALSRNFSEILDVLRSPEAACLEKRFVETPRDLLLDETSRLLDGIREGAGRTARIVKRLISYARPAEEEAQEADIAYLLDSALTLLEIRHPEDIKIELRYAARPFIRCFPVKLTQLFHCVLENAFDAARTSGDPCVRVELDTKTDNGRSSVIVAISDSGPGVSAELRHRIFTPFFTTKDMGQGAGLGLSIARGIALEHGGEIELMESDGSGGAVFRVILPVRPRSVDFSVCRNCGL